MTDRSLEFAESTRDASKHTGFLAGLFEGRVRWQQLFPYPEKAPTEQDKLRPHLYNLEKVLRVMVDPEKIDATGEIPKDVITHLTVYGFFGIKIPEEYGGLELSQSNYKELAVMLGSWDSSVTALISAHNSIGVCQPLLQFGTEKQKRRYLPKIAGGAITGFALTEEEAGSDLTRVRTFALKQIDPESGNTSYKIFGRKLYITNGPKNHREFLAKYLVVIARIVNSVTQANDTNAKPIFGAFIVDTQSLGCRVVHRCDFMGIKAIYSGVIDFCGVEVTKEELIGQEGDGIKIALATLAIGRLTLPAACCGAFKQALSISRWWAAKRVQWFNKRIGDHELISKKLADIAAHVLALEAMVNITCRRADEKKDIRLESAACKVLGSKWLWENLNEALQIRSGRGYETYKSQFERGEIGIPIERMARDARINLIFEGTNEIMRLWQAREEMDAYIKRGMIIEKGGWLAKTGALWGIAWRFIRYKSNKIDYSRINPRLRKHMRFVEKESRRLTRVAIAATVFYRRKLIKKQLVMARLSDVAAELFAVTAVCSYASARTQAVELADYFCWEARKRIHPLSGLRSQIFGDPNDNQAWQVAQTILDGKLIWLEDGILPILKPDKRHTCDDIGCV